MNWIKFAAINSVKLLAVNGGKFTTCNGLKLVLGNAAQAANVRAFSFISFPFCDQVCRDFGRIPYLNRPPGSKPLPESDSAAGSDSTSGGGSGSKSGKGSDSGSNSKSGSGSQSGSNSTAKDTSYGYSCGYGDDEDEREKNKRRKIPGEHERDADLDSGGCLATILSVGDLEQYVEGEDRRLTHRLQNATLTRGLVNCKKRGTDNEENSDDPIVDYRTGLDGRPEYIRAVLHGRYFRSSQRNGSRKLKCSIRARGIDGDAVGHILGHQLGGPFEGNLYPQNPSLNGGYWRAEENSFHKWLQESEDHTIDFQARLIHNDENFPMRPTRVVYLIKFYKNGRLATTEEIFDCVGEVMEPITMVDLPNPPPTERFKQNSNGDYT